MYVCMYACKFYPQTWRKSRAMPSTSLGHVAVQKSVCLPPTFQPLTGGWKSLWTLTTSPPRNRCTFL